MSGLIILVGISIASLSLGIITLVSAVIGTWIGFVGVKDKTVVYQGLFGYNSVLTGLALSLFLNGNQKWAVALAGAAFAALVTAAVMHLMRNSGLPVLTVPYVVLTWFVLLASFHLDLVQMSSELVPQDLSHWKLHIRGKIDWIDGLVDGIGQVYFQENFWSSILILIAVFWAGWKLGLCAILGTVVAWLTAFILGAEVNMLNGGLYGYNAVLSVLAVAAVFHVKDRLEILMGIFAAILSVLITAGLGGWLIPYGLPTLTMPFVFVTWTFLAARKILTKL